MHSSSPTQPSTAAPARPHGRKRRRTQVIHMPKVNPKVLAWARKTAAMSKAEAVEALGLKAAHGLDAEQRLADLESGKTEPTRPMLKKMAAAYHRPILALYQSKPPKEGDRGEDFRTAAGQEPPQDPVLDALVRSIRVGQAILLSALQDEEDADPLSIVGSSSISDGIAATAKAIEEALGFDLDEFRKGDYGKAFAYLRRITEDIGVFVVLRGDLGSHHTKLDVTTFRGFAIADPIAPFIVINSYNAKPAQSFTLLHELVHIWLGATGLSNSLSDRKIEKFCNSVAASILLGNEELDSLALLASSSTSDLANDIQEFARARNISGAMVAYGLYRGKHIAKHDWRELTDELVRRWIQTEKHQKAQRTKSDGNGGPNYYTVQRYKMGKGLLETVGNLMHADALTASKAGLVLGLKPQQVPRALEGII